MDRNYIFGALLFLLLVVVLDVFLLGPAIRGPILRAWYKRQRTNWLEAGSGRVNNALSTFVRSRYVRQSDTDGTISPLDDCSTYLHPFLFTDRGHASVVALAAVDQQQLSILSSHRLPYSAIRSLRLREYVTECLADPVTDWPRLFHRDDDSKEDGRRVISGLSRYTYKVSFAAATGPTSIPTTAGAAIEAVATTTTTQPPPLLLTFEFTDHADGERCWSFVLPQYRKSTFGGVVSAANEQSDTAVDVWKRLPPLWLERSTARTVPTVTDPTDLRDRSIVLFSRALTDDTPNELNPCWNPWLQRFVVGQFPVSPQQYSAIYLRGLQRVTDADLHSDSTVRQTLSRLYWRCVWDYGEAGNSRDDDDDDLDNNNKNSILYDTLLSLNLCEQGGRFDSISGKCVV